MRNSLRPVALSLLAVALLGAGCAYGGATTTQDGSVVITRNDLILFGLLRKVYVCKQTGSELVCTETKAP
jgi:hypothetical protein